MQVRLAVFIHLHAVVGDGAEGILLDKLLEVVLGKSSVRDVLGRDLVHLLYRCAWERPSTFTI